MSLGKTIDVTEIVGIREMLDMLHVRDSTLSNWVRQRIMADNRGTGFPEPIRKLAMGPIWDAEEVRAWYRKYTPQKGHPKVGYLEEDGQHNDVNA